MASVEIYPEITVREYLDGEPEAQVRHEYLAGKVFAMAGGTQRHNLISGAIHASLFVALRGKPCKPFINDMKVQVKTHFSESYYYPDVVITCDTRDINPQFLQFPTAIFEVLSESTERIDRLEKFQAYTNLESLQEYILVSQEKKQVTIARRVNDWKTEILTGDEGEITLSCGTTLNIAEIYDQVDVH